MKDLQITITSPEEGSKTQVLLDLKIPSRPVRIIFSLGMGFLLGVFFHYLLYRISLPSQPFIYVNF